MAFPVVMEYGTNLLPSGTLDPNKSGEVFCHSETWKNFPAHPAPHLIWHFRISPSGVIQLCIIGCVWRPCEVLAQWGQSKSIQSCAIAPGTPRMDSDSRPLRLVKFWIRIRKGKTGVCLEIKDMLMRLSRYTPWDPFPILISPML